MAPLPPRNAAARAATAGLAVAHTPLPQLVAPRRPSPTAPPTPGASALTLLRNQSQSQLAPHRSYRRSTAILLS